MTNIPYIASPSTGQLNSDSRSTYSITSKTCPKCWETKSIFEFNKNRTSHDGLQSYCRKCFRDAARKSAVKRTSERASLSQKCCKGCRKTKPINEFSKKPDNFDGRHHFCKDCRMKLRKEKCLEMEKSREAIKEKVCKGVCGEKKKR
jgi:hypothetical protein